jgi:hypothetical protein
MVMRKIPSPCQESNPRTPIIQPVAATELSQLFKKPIVSAMSEGIKMMVQDVCQNIILHNRSVEKFVRCTLGNLTVLKSLAECFWT